MILGNEVLTSRSNPVVRETAALQEKKYREAEGAFIAEGEKLFREAAAAHLPILRVFLREDRRTDLLPSVERALAEERYAGVKVLLVSESVFEKISTENAPQGILTVIKYLDFFKKCTIIRKIDIDAMGRGIFLSSLRDPGNLGSVIRSAAGFGVDTLILSGDCADLYHPKTIRAAMGTMFRLRVWIAEDSVGTVEQLRAAGRRVFAAELRERAVSLDSLPLDRKDIFVIGNEGHGIPDEVSRACDGSVYIPIAPGVESLNAAVAAAIFLREQSRALL